MPELSSLQRAVLHAFFARERGFFLTGGAALTGFYLHHRTTSDLDLFTADEEAFERVARVLGEVAQSLGSKLEVRQDSPAFKRCALATSDDLVVVDLVLDRVAQAIPQKAEVDGVIVDPIDEIFINKLTALVGRQEERDLVDVYFLEQKGLRVEDALPAALAKDGGCTPANLAWLLSQVEIPDGLALPPPLTPERLRDYVRELVRRMRKAALPS